MVCGATIAVSPWLTWYEGTVFTPGSWSGVELYADRDELKIAGGVLMMGFDADGWYESLFGPVIPVLIGVVLGVVGFVVVVRRAARTPTWAAALGVAAALWSLGAAGLTGRSGVYPSGEIGGPGLRVWAIGSAMCAVGFGVQVTRGWLPGPNSTGVHGALKWLSVPALLASVPFLVSLYWLEDLFPFATVRVFLAASLAAAFPAIGTVIALVTVVQPRRSAVVVAVSSFARVLAVLLFGLWTRLALA